jgi:photosynthetic reaction center H subunit
VPAVTFHGDLKIVPMRTLPDFSISARDADPRGMVVLGCDGVTAGTVTDVWVDRAEVMIRYLELTLAAAADQHVLLPQTMARIDKRRRMVLVSAITGGQFADVPRLEHPEQVTFYEEERITAYYGGGFLYATPGRSEPRV